MALGMRRCHLIGLPGLQTGKQAHVHPEELADRIRLLLADPQRQFNPCMVTAVVLNRLNPSIGAILDFTPRWSCSIRLFKYFDDRSVVSAGSSLWVFKFAHGAVRGGVAIQRDSPRARPPDA